MINEIAKVISFVNMKGGVCKTSLTINIGNQLSNLGYNVLIVDMDPQFNATQSLLLHKSILMNESMRNNITDKKEYQEFEFEQEINSAEKYKELSQNRETVLQLFGTSNITAKLENPTLTHKIKEKLYLMPGDLSVAKEITGDTAGKLNCLLDHFRKYDMLKNYHFILIDCPPTWSILTHASLYVSDYYVIPSKVDLYSSIGIQLLEEQVDSKLRNNSIYKDHIYKKVVQGHGKEIERLGVVFTLVDTLQAEKKRKEKLREEFQDIHFFDTELPYIRSVPTKIVMYEDVEGNSNYTQLNNAISKITREILEKIK
ncbi:AAA family ATPase [Tissierella sp.]|uniref:ParA family protein n=1 Tax=Tissierella sp. TaxID=41274 RepID=UPI0028A965B5|nr:AAA family ATPase [Tissierella sp.]